MNSSMIILYVADQQRSREFYSRVLDREPVLHVPGMTEFKLTENFLLGLMPEKGIAKLISPPMPHPETGRNIPRCELYLFVEDPDAALTNAIDAGAKLIRAAENMDWGDRAGYCADQDGHIIVFARRINEK